MREEEIIFLKQLVNTLEEAEIKFERAYAEKDSETLNKIKKFMLQIADKIEGVVK